MMSQDLHRLRERYETGSSRQERTDTLVRRVTIVVAIAAVVVVLVSAFLLFGLDRLR